MDQSEQLNELKNAVTIEDAGPCKKKVTVEIPAETVKKVTDEQYAELRREVVIPGFRKGRAPRRLLEKRFGKETAEQIKLRLVSEASEAAIKDNELDVIGDLQIDYEKIALPEEGPLKFDFEVEVRPEFELPKLEGIPVERPKLEVTDEQIDREIEQLRRLSGTWTPREQGQVELDDQVLADVKVKLEQDEQGEQEQTFEDLEIYVRANGFVAGIPVEQLDKLLVGSEVGQTKQTTVEVPKTYFRQEYRGKKVELEITIKDIKWLKPAELDESLLSRLGVDDVEELRERVRDRLQSQLERQARAQMTDQIYKYLLENTDFDLPLDIVAEQAKTLLQRQYTSLLIRGLPAEQIEQQMEQLRASSEERAKEQLKTFFIMDKVAEQLGIEVTEEEVNGYIAQLAVQRGQRPERLREQMARDGSLGQFRLEVRTDKCIAKLLESAEIKEVEPKKEPAKATKGAKQQGKSSSTGKKKRASKAETKSKKQKDT